MRAISSVCSIPACIPSATRSVSLHSASATKGSPLSRPSTLPGYGRWIRCISQIAQEGAIQIFKELGSGMEEIIAGVVGMLQLDVLKFRLESEYNVEIRMDVLPYEHIRWVKSNTDVRRITGTTDMKRVEDMKGNPLLLFINPWSVQMVLERNEGLVLEEFSRN